MSTAPILIATLEGADLDYWVAKAQGLDAKIANGWCYLADQKAPPRGAGPHIMQTANEKGLFGRTKLVKSLLGWLYSPSTEPGQGQPIMEAEGICLLFEDGPGTFLGEFVSGPRWLARRHTSGFNEMGRTQLVAGMRAYLASVYGDTIPTAPSGAEKAPQ